MDFVGAIKAGFTNYANFKGVAGKAEYWYFVLFIFLVNILLSFIDNFDDSGIISTAVSLALLLPSLSVLYRRLRDAGRSPLWFWGSLVSGLVFVILIIGLIVYLFTSGLINALMTDPSQITDDTIEQWFADPTGSVVFFMALISGLIAAILNILVSIVFCLQPSKTAEQGNKYVLPENPTI